MASIAIRPGDLVEAGLYHSEDEAIAAAIADLLDHRPVMRLSVAAYLYERDEDWSVAGIAQWAGVTSWEMRDFLASRGVELRLGPATLEEAREEVETARRYFRDHPR